MISLVFTGSSPWFLLEVGPAPLTRLHGSIYRYGMSSTHFDFVGLHSFEMAFIRFVLDALLESADEKDEDKRKAKMDKVLDNLQKTLED